MAANDLTNHEGPDELYEGAKCSAARTQSRKEFLAPGRFGSRLDEIQELLINFLLEGGAETVRCALVNLKGRVFD